MASKPNQNIVIFKKGIGDTWPKMKCQNIKEGTICERESIHLCTMKLPETGMHSFNGERICGMPFCAICCGLWGCEHDMNRCKKHMS